MTNALTPEQRAEAIIGIFAENRWLFSMNYLGDLVAAAIRAAEQEARDQGLYRDLQRSVEVLAQQRNDLNTALKQAEGIIAGLESELKNNLTALAGLIANQNELVAAIESMRHQIELAMELKWNEQKVRNADAHLAGWRAGMESAVRACTSRAATLADVHARFVATGKSVDWGSWGNREHEALACVAVIKALPEPSERKTQP